MPRLLRLPEFQDELVRFSADYGVGDPCGVRVGGVAQGVAIAGEPEAGGFDLALDHDVLDPVEGRGLAGAGARRGLVILDEINAARFEDSEGGGVIGLRGVASAR